MKKVRLVSILLFILIAFASLAYAEVPKLINYQGHLTNKGGNPLTGTVSITFRIYDAATGGDLKWTETQNSIEVKNGIFNVLLGSATSGGIPESVFDSPDRWLGVAVQGDSETSPRQQLVSVPYAYNAGKASQISIPGGAIAGPDAPNGVMHIHNGSISGTCSEQWGGSYIAPVSFSDSNYTVTLGIRHDTRCSSLEIINVNKSPEQFQMNAICGDLTCNVVIDYIAIGQ